MEQIPATHPNPRLARFTRWQAAGIHASISAAIGALALVLMLAVWYPGELFRIAGGSTLIVILVGVDVVLGPLLTLVVFDPAKRLLKLDLAVIATTQLVALAYGTFVMFEARPSYLVFVVDRIDVVSAIEVDAAARADARRDEFRDINLGRPMLVAAVMPTDPAERNEVVAAAAGGVDLMLTPRYWVPYAEAKAQVLARARPLADIRKVDPAVNGPVLDAALAALGRPAESLRALGVKAKDGEAVMLVDATTGEPVEMVGAVW
jgi:hypothetical protein